MGVVARQQVTTPPVSSSLAASFAAASIKCFQLGSRIQRLVILSDVHQRARRHQLWELLTGLLLPLDLQTERESIEARWRKKGTGTGWRGTREEKLQTAASLQGPHHVPPQEPRMRSETMALGHGLKRSTSCEQQVAPPPLSCEVSHRRCWTPVGEHTQKVQRILTAFWFQVT